VAAEPALRLDADRAIRLAMPRLRQAARQRA
jgi:hypothetical protein